MSAPHDDIALERYETALRPHRDAFAERSSIRLIGSAARDADLLHLFLIQYSARGISMTRPVESWIRRAGERCRALGYLGIGDALIAHAPHEAGHHALMIADLWTLAGRGAAGHAARLDPVALARSGPPESVRQYADLHESIIAGPGPFAQIAVEYEIEALSVRHGADLIATAGPSLGSGLSFLRSHVAVDAGHTRFNRRQIGRFLARYPEHLGALVAAGAAALDIYGRFVEDCLRAALHFAPGDGRPLQLRLHFPTDAAPGAGPPDWLAGVRALRSQVLHDGGRRPAFGPGGPAFGDPDMADPFCVHLVLCDDGPPVGVIRLLELGSGRKSSVVEQTFGRRALDDALRLHAVRPEDCLEASRLVLHAGYRRGATVRRLLAAAWVFAAETGVRGLFAAAGTRDHQDRLLALFGAMPVAGVAAVASAEFEDRVRLMWLPVDPAAPPDYPEIDLMREAVARERRAAGRRIAA